MSIPDLLQNKSKYDSTGHAHDQSRPKADLLERFSGVYHEVFFGELLRLEIKRSERSRKQFLLMLNDFGGFEEGFERQQIAKKVADALSSVSRDTDFKGWYQHGTVLGVIFTELDVREENFKAEHRYLVEKCRAALEIGLSKEEYRKISVTWHIFPGRLDTTGADDPPHGSVYEDVLTQMARKRAAHRAKRAIDIAGSLCALILFSPIFFIIACLVKLSSEGPVFFKQERVGLLGKRFMFLKFRSMYKDNDASIHREFVKNLICGTPGENGGKGGAGQRGTYKITEDPRVTPLGHFLRKTSLDELPQFINVLKGDMSLVGPRPPIPYECADYDIWHRRRVLEMKPGITGLWQVKGRSRTTFDDMVRMDIRYIREWSIWLDLKIMIQTPLAAITGKGAY